MMFLLTLSASLYSAGQWMRTWTSSPNQRTLKHFPFVSDLDIEVDLLQEKDQPSSRCLRLTTLHFVWFGRIIQCLVEEGIESITFLILQTACSW